MRRAAALCLLALLVTAQSTQAQEAKSAPPDVPPGPGTIRARVVHQEDAERSVSGVALVLYALTRTGLAGMRHGVSDAEGRFSFEGVANDPTTPYLIGAEYQGVSYSGTRVVFSPGELEQEVEIRVARSDHQRIEDRIAQRRPPIEDRWGLAFDVGGCGRFPGVGNRVLGHLVVRAHRATGEGRGNEEE